MACRVARGRLGSAEGDDALDVWEHIAFAQWLADHPRPSAFAPVDVRDDEVDVDADAVSEWELTDIEDLYESADDDDGW